MTVSIYHNPRCSKSRKALEILQNKNIDLKIIPYLDQGITKAEVLELSSLLSLNVIDFIRTKEEEFKSLDIDSTDNDACAKAISDFPKILERPIVIKDGKAIVARPPENLEELF